MECGGLPPLFRSGCWLPPPTRGAWGKPRSEKAGASSRTPHPLASQLLNGLLLQDTSAVSRKFLPILHEHCQEQVRPQAGAWGLGKKDFYSPSPEVPASGSRSRYQTYFRDTTLARRGIRFNRQSAEKQEDAKGRQRVEGQGVVPAGSKKAQRQSADSHALAPGHSLDANHA